MRRPWNIRHVKKEIRVLGVAVKPSHNEDGLHMVGVVFRGKLWLDGVMRASARGPDLTDILVEMITGSSHHPQIRVIMLHDALIEGGASIDPYKLSTMTSRPVLFLSKERKGPAAPEAPPGEDAHRFMLTRVEEAIAVLSVGLRRHTALKVLQASTRKSCIPEALRVAGLVASAVAGCPEQNV